MGEPSSNRDRSPIDSNRGGGFKPIGSKVYISNLPFEAKWQNVKDLFTENVGEVINFDLFKNERGQSRGCGIMEFASSELAQEAIKTMDKFLWKGRKMYVKVSEDADRDEYGRIIAGPKARVDKSDITNEYRIYISNLPLDIKWQDVKDIFRNQVGDVTHAKLFTDQSGRPRGCGVLEFSSIELAKQAVQKMNRQDVRGRRITVQPLGDEERDKFGYVINKNNTGMGSYSAGPAMPMMSTGLIGNTYGLSVEFLQSLGIDGPLHTKLHVTNLEFRVDEKKLREVFRIAGQVCAVEICRDGSGGSRGFGTVIFTHPLEAVQAISMLNHQTLYDRPLNIRFDREPEFEEPGKYPLGVLPEGLGGVGMGLGQGGAALTQFPSQNDYSMDGASDPSRVVAKALAEQLTPALSMLASQISAGSVGGGQHSYPQAPGYGSSMQQGYGYGGGYGSMQGGGSSGGSGGYGSMAQARGYNMGAGGYSNGKNLGYGGSKKGGSLSDIPIPESSSSAPRYGPKQYGT